MVTVRQRLEVAVKLGLGAEARTLADSFAKFRAGADPRFVEAGFDLTFGHFAKWDAAVARRGAGLDTVAVTYYRQVARAVVGLPSPDLDRLTWAYFAVLRDSVCNRDCRLRAIVASHAYVVGLVNPTWSPTFAPSVADIRHRFAYALTSRDSATIRRATLAVDSTVREDVRTGWQDGARSLIVANGFLAIHDSAAALVAARFAVDNAMGLLRINQSQFCVGTNMCVAPSLMFPRMMLLRADLEVAVGRPEAAKVWYDRVLDLWATADAEMQPLVERIRKARAALGP
jgi:hypothetical protein